MQENPCDALGVLRQTVDAMCERLSLLEEKACDPWRYKEPANYSIWSHTAGVSREVEDLNARIDELQWENQALYGKLIMVRDALDEALADDEEDDE